MICDSAPRALAVGRERPGRIDCDDPSAESGTNQGVQVIDASAERRAGPALFALLGDLGFTDGAAEHARG